MRVFSTFPFSCRSVILIEDEAKTAHFRPAFARLQERPPLKNLCVSRLFGVCLGNLQELSLPAWAFTVRKDKNIVHNIRGSDLRFVVQMTVNIRRGGNVAVTEPFLNLLHRDVIGKQQRRAAVPLRYNYDKPGKP